MTESYFSNITLAITQVTHICSLLEFLFSQSLIDIELLVAYSTPILAEFKNYKTFFYLYIHLSRILMMTRLKLLSSQMGCCLGEHNVARADGRRPDLSVNIRVTS